MVTAWPANQTAYYKPPPNTRSKDFICPQCSHGYELKSTSGTFGRRITDGAVSAMTATIREGRTPSFLLLEYSSAWEVRDLTAIHHSLITQDCIEKRRALGPTARRAGWVGCNIVLPKIALEGRIPIVTAGNAHSREASKQLLRVSSFFRECLRREEVGLRPCSTFCVNFRAIAFP